MKLQIGFYDSLRSCHICCIAEYMEVMNAIIKILKKVMALQRWLCS